MYVVWSLSSKFFWLIATNCMQVVHVKVMEGNRWHFAVQRVIDRVPHRTARFDASPARHIQPSMRACPAMMLLWAYRQGQWTPGHHNVEGSPLIDVLWWWFSHTAYRIPNHWSVSFIYIVYWIPIVYLESTSNLSVYTSQEARSKK